MFLDVITAPRLSQSPLSVATSAPAAQVPQQGTHALLRQCIQVGCITENKLELFHPRTRDNDQISAWRDSASGVIILNSCDHIDVSDYQQRELGTYWGANDLADARNICHHDDRRRAALAAEMAHLNIRSNNWLDVGTGAGGFLHHLHALRPDLNIQAVEPQRAVRQALQHEGWDISADLADIRSDSIDYLSAWHVFEHVTDPSSFLNECRRVLKPGGQLLLEVPHARDALLTRYRCAAFRQFTLWSEHLILHTKQSLFAFAQTTGFDHTTVIGVQRYPLANHIGWLHEGRPGGQTRYHDLATGPVAEAYAQTLTAADQSDTLILKAQCPQ